MLNLEDRDSWLFIRVCFCHDRDISLQFSHSRERSYEAIVLDDGQLQILDGMSNKKPGNDGQSSITKLVHRMRRLLRSRYIMNWRLRTLDFSSLGLKVRQWAWWSEKVESQLVLPRQGWALTTSQAARPWEVKLHVIQNSIEVDLLVLVFFFKDYG